MPDTEISASEEVGFRPELFENLFESEAGSFWFRSRNRFIIWALGKYFPDAASMLEVGCGTGFVLNGIREAFPKLKLSGSELYAEGLHFAQQRLPEVDFKQLDARALPFAQAYDVIGAFDVLEHIQEDELVLSELFKAAKQGIVITVPQHGFLWSAVDELACHKRRYSAAELKEKVEKAGFRIVRMTSFVSFLLPLMVLSRYKKRSAKDVDQSEFNLPETINSLFERTIDLERQLVKAGLNLPLGGSILLVAFKT